MFCTWIFQLKELEKLGPKKGVISQSVKDVVQSLVDDDLVAKDKIGTSVSLYFQEGLKIEMWILSCISYLVYSIYFLERATMDLLSLNIFVCAHCSGILLKLIWEITVIFF